MHTVNIGIVAHVDAGKTSLTERLLYETGVIDRLGSVDAGTTQTDSGAIERRRGITIRSAVAAFRVGDRQVNLIDTPGHSDFVAEVERALGVLDGAVLVISAVEGVQPHTRLLMRTLRALRLPTLLFVNKIDRAGARAEGLVADVARLLTPGVAPMGTVRGAGTAAAAFIPDAHGDALVTALAEHDDAVLAALVDGGPVPDIQRALREQTAAATVHPLLFGSALTGAGVPELLAAVGTVLPPSPPAEDDLRARVFAIERGGGGEKVAYVRSYGGRLRRRQRVTAYRREPDGRITNYRAQVTAVEVAGGDRDELTAGHIGRVRGLPQARIGDQLGNEGRFEAQPLFARPGLETVVRAREPRDGPALHAALLRLADEDPLIRTRVTADGETSVLLYGEVQKEVIGATLAEVYGVAAEFAPSRIMHVERPVGVGTGLEIIGNGFFGTVGFRVEPGEGVRYRLEVELGSLPLSFHKAIEDTVLHALEQGAYGWPVVDVTVTLTHSGYWSPITTAGHFRDLTPLVLMQALAAAGTRVHEPCHRFEVDVPAARLGAVTGHMVRCGGRIDDTVDGGDETFRIGGEMPARKVAEFRGRLPSLSNGEGVFTSTPEGDRAVVGQPPRRERTDGNPFDRTEYTRFLAQRELATATRSRG